MSDLVSLCMRETILESPHTANWFVTANSEGEKAHFSQLSLGTWLQMGINLQEVSLGYVKCWSSVNKCNIIHNGFRHTDTHKPIQWTVILNMQAASDVQPLIV